MTKWPTVPPQGWHYFQEESRIEGETFEQLADNLASYRAANHLPAGDPKSDIERFVAARWPHVLGLKEAPPDPDLPKTIYGKPEVKQLAQRVGSWCANRFSRIGAIHFVEADVAQRRANTCLACPANVGNWKHETVENCPGCASSVEAVTVLSYKIRRGRSVEREGKLGACSILGHDGQCAVHLDASGLQHAKHYQNLLPSVCWCRNSSSTNTSTASAPTSAAQA